jgi:hypothetical protein
MEQRRYSAGAGRAALVGVLSALSLAVLYFAALAPVGQLGLVALSGLLPAVAVISAGLPAGVLCYAATGILGLLLIPDKGGAALYLLFFGLYPLVKCLIERLGKLPLEFVCKLAFFNVTFAVAWFTLRAVLLAGLPAAFEKLWLLWTVGNAVFMVYDLGFSRIIALYRIRIDKLVRRS